MVLDSSEMRLHVFAHSEIVNSPAHIPRSRSRSITPPSIMIPQFWILQSKYIDHPKIFHFVHFCSLYRQKSNRIDIFLWSGDIDFTMTNIKISGRDYFLSLRDQPFDLFLILRVKIELIAEHFGSIRSISTIWEIDIEKHKI